MPGLPRKPQQQKSSRNRRMTTFSRSSGGTALTRHPLLVSLVCAALAVVLLLAYVSQVNARAREEEQDVLARYGGDQVEVCVAARDIAAGELVEASSVTTKVWVSTLLPEGALRQVGDVVGRKATSLILAGEVICQARFADAEVALEVPAGLTAVSVPAKDVQAVGGVIEPGMYIDIYATGNAATQLIGSNVLVLATNRQPGGAASTTASTSGQAIQWITLALAPESVEETVAAAQGLSLYFTLPGEGVERAQPAQDGGLVAGQASTGSVAATDADAAADAGGDVGAVVSTGSAVAEFADGAVSVVGAVDDADVAEGVE